MLFSTVNRQGFTKFPIWNDNTILLQVLAFNKSEKLSPFKSVNCQKRTNHYYGRLTPLHSAALNPNANYLKQVCLWQCPFFGSFFTFDCASSICIFVQICDCFLDWHAIKFPVSVRGNTSLISTVPHINSTQMLRENPQPEITDLEGYTPLHYAAFAETAAATKFLLGQNVNPLVTNNKVRSDSFSWITGISVNVRIWVRG